MDEAAVDELRANFQVAYDPTLVDRPDALSQAVADARALIVRNRTQVRGALLAGATRLEAVGRLGVGLDNIDLDACRARGIAVLPASGANATAVAEYVDPGRADPATPGVRIRPRHARRPMAARGADRPRDRRPPPGPRRLRCHRPRGRRQGPGAGHDRRCLRPLPGSGRPCLGDGRAPPELGTLLAVADVLSLHVPLTDATRGLIGAAVFAAMRHDAVLINTSRGGIVDEPALAAACARAGSAVPRSTCSPASR